MSEVWTKWEGQVVDGFPLRRCLGVSDHSGVFLTEAPAHDLANAAVKLVPLIPTLAESQLAHWSAAASLSHPRLLRLFSMGRAQLGSLHCLYVVMEYAEQNLADFLAQRALTDTEVREMLPATLDVLAFLHSHNLVHGQLKPSNILVVGEQLKLASDTLRPAGEAATSISMLSVYDPPEGRDGSFSTAGDIWALGVTLFEALTRTTPPKPDERSHGVVLPPDFPPGCAEIIRECLSRRPVDRPSVASLQVWVNGALRKPAPIPDRSAAAAAAFQASATAGPGLATGGVTPDPAAGRLTIRAVVEREPAPIPREPRWSPLPFAVTAVAIIAVAWLGWRFLGNHGSSPPMAPVAPPEASQQSPPATTPNTGNTSAATPESNTSPPAASRVEPRSSAPETVSSRGSVVHEEMPKVSRSALATIHGHVRVVVRVTVDASGTVVEDTLANPGPSRYFARVAAQAARKWKFTPASGKAPRQWLVHFEFSHSGTTAHATQRS